jgi:hypothetical protein
MKYSAVAPNAQALTVTAVARNPSPKAFALVAPSAGAVQRVRVATLVRLARNEMRDDHGYIFWRR